MRSWDLADVWYYYYFFLVRLAWAKIPASFGSSAMTHNSLLSQSYKDVIVYISVAWKVLRIWTLFYLMITSIILKICHDLDSISVNYNNSKIIRNSETSSFIFKKV